MFLSAFMSVLSSPARPSTYTAGHLSHFHGKSKQQQLCPAHTYYRHSVFLWSFVIYPEIKATEVTLSASKPCPCGFYFRIMYMHSWGNPKKHTVYYYRYQGVPKRFSCSWSTSCVKICYSSSTQKHTNRQALYVPAYKNSRRWCLFCARVQ